MTKRPLQIAITGGIGSGKSTVTKIFETLGIPIFDADSTAKNIMNTDTVVKAKIEDTFGKEAYVNGMLDRKYIATIVFKDKFKLELLNSIVHPATIKAAKDWFVLQTAPYAIKEAALIFESGTAGDADYIIGVHAPKNVRVQRVKERDNVSVEEIIRRMDNQMDENIKMHLCDFVIENDGIHAILPQVLQLHNFFVKTPTK